MGFGPKPSKIDLTNLKPADPKDKLAQAVAEKLKKELTKKRK
jgi:hypothetical protein